MLRFGFMMNPLPDLDGQIQIEVSITSIYITSMTSVITIKKIVISNHGYPPACYRCQEHSGYPHVDYLKLRQRTVTS